MKITNVINYLEELYPIKNASETDISKIGLQIGDSEHSVTGILLTLDLTKEVIMDAVNKNCNLIISHHPYIYNPLQTIIYSSPSGEVLSLMIKHNLSLYVMHTNLDVGFDGVNDTLAKKIGMVDYNSQIENVAQDSFLRTGEISPQSIRSYAKFVKEQLQLTGVRVVGDLDKIITKVGVIGGSGGKISEINQAIALGCDLLVTSEISHHIAHYAITNDFSIIEVAHGVEKFVFESLITKLKNKFNNINIYITTINTDPFVVL